MSCDPMIEVINVGKEFKIYSQPIDRIREMYSVRRRSYHTLFKAVDRVSFEVYPGETVGIIGPNGSGKSTLLEMICGTLTPSQGRVRVNGRISALLELGAGFNPVFTGRENVYLSAALMGITETEIDSKFDAIVDFADIGQFIEHPVSTYSSGMYVRLAFATAINTDPDILIVDEALAVGDIRFQRKCYRRFEELQEKGKTILFVTHALDLIQAHCSRALYLNRGSLKSLGEPKSVIQGYLEDLFGSEVQQGMNDVSEDAKIGDVEGKVLNDAEVKQSPPPVNQTWFTRDHPLDVPQDRFKDRPLYNPNEYRWGDQRAILFDYSITDQSGKAKVFFNRLDRVRLTASIFFKVDLSRLIFGFTIKTVDGRVVFGANTRERGIAVSEFKHGETTELTFDFTASLIPGDYFISLGIALDNDETDNEAVDRRYDVINFPVIGAPGDFGLADIGLEIKLN